MTISPILFAGVVFFGYFLGRCTGFNSGYNAGLASMKQRILADMRKYPTKWKFHIDKEQK